MFYIEDLCVRAFVHLLNVHMLVTFVGRLYISYNFVSSLILVGGWMKAWVGEGVSLTWKQIIFQPTLLSALPPPAIHLPTGPL